MITGELILSITITFCPLTYVLREEVAEADEKGVVTLSMERNAE